jgi:hypothetical protein
MVRSRPFTVWRDYVELWISAFVLPYAYPDDFSNLQELMSPDLAPVRCFRACNFQLGVSYPFPLSSSILPANTNNSG